MVKISIAILFFLLNYYTFSQTPEWMIIDLQQSLQYEWNKSLFGYDLDMEEILDISLEDFGQIWFTTQNFLIKYLPNSILLYPFSDPERVLFSFPNSNFNNICYSRINEKEILEKYPQNSWIEYEYHLGKDLANKRITGSYLDKYIISYKLNKYSAPLSFDSEISIEEFSSNFLISYPAFLFELVSNQNSQQAIDKSFLTTSNKLNYRKGFNPGYYGKHIFDVDKDAFGNIWIATGKNLIRFDGSKFFIEDIPAITLESADCNLWIGTAAYGTVGSLIKFDGRDFTFFNYLNSPLPENAGILDIKKDNNGNLWIALKRSGLPGQLENIKLVVLNEDGINLRDVIGLQSAYFQRDLTALGGMNFLTDKLTFEFNTVDLKSDESLDFYLNNDLIYTAYPKTDRFETQNQIFYHTLIHRDKYNTRIYLNDSFQNKFELMHFIFDLRMNDFNFYLAQNLPNPFIGQTKIEYTFSEGRNVEIILTDVYGRMIASSFEKYVGIWAKPFIFKAGNNPNGVYFYYLKERYNGIIDAKKMLLFDPKKL